MEYQNPRRAKLTSKLIATLTPEAERYRVRDTEIPNYFLIVYPSGKMSYSYVYRTPQGKRPTFIIGRHGPITPAQARKAAAAKAAEIRLGGDPQGERKKARQETVMPTLREFIEGDYGNWVTANRESGRQTVNRVRAAFRDFGDTPLDKITEWNFEKWCSRRLKDGIARSTVKRDRNALQGVLTKACKWGILESNPLSSVKALTVDDSPNVRYFNNDEEQRFRRTLDAREERLRTERDTANAWRRVRGRNEMSDLRAATFSDHLKPMALLSMNTGLRRGELFHLTWSCVDFGKAQITVIGRPGTKTKTRHIPLNKEALDVLRGWKAQQQSHEGIVFLSKDSKPFNNTKKAWAGLLKQAQITAFRWHDLRHHFASKLVMAGVDLNTVRELLGHGDIKMTLRYAHLAPEHKAAAVARLLPNQ